MSRRRSKRRVKKMVGYGAVGLVSVVLVVLIVLGLVRTPGEVDPLVRDPDVVIDGEGYDRRRELRHTLMIGVPDDDSFGAQYLTLITTDMTTKQYYFTNIDYRIKTWIKPLNVRDNTANEQGLIEAALGKAQTYGNGGQTSSWNTAEAIERMLDISITTVICLHTTAGEAPMFQSAPATALTNLLTDIKSSVVSTGKSFKVAVGDICVWSNFTSEKEFENLIEQLNSYTCTPESPYTLGGTPVSEGLYEVDQKKLNDLRVRLYLKKVDTETTVGGQS